MRALEHDMLRGERLDLSWYEVLARLDQSAEGQLRMQKLADSLVYSRSGVTRLLDRMEKAGLVERHPDANDRRGWNAIITVRGRERMKRARPCHRRGIQNHFLRHLNYAEVQTLNELLSKVLTSETSSR